MHLKTNNKSIIRQFHFNYQTMTAIEMHLIFFQLHISKSVTINANSREIGVNY